MSKFKKGDIVGRISYNKDVLFEITKIIRINKNKKIMILKGITERIEADSPEEDLEIMDKRIIQEKINKLEIKMSRHIEKCMKDTKNYIYQVGKILQDKNEQRSSRIINTGKILHLDGDKRYSEKSMKYYKSLGLNAIVKNIAENKQAQVVKNLLERYKPDILVITGHDGMIKKGTGFSDLYNYRNSRYFINTVNEARKWNSHGKDIAIFAGACQSFYEAIMEAGANFASSPRKNND